MKELTKNEISYISGGADLYTLYSAVKYAVFAGKIVETLWTHRGKTLLAIYALTISYGLLSGDISAPKDKGLGYKIPYYGIRGATAPIVIPFRAVTGGISDVWNGFKDALYDGFVA